MPDNEYLERMERDLIERGKRIEAGWLRLRTNSIPLSAPLVQVNAMRTAFYMGADHLFRTLDDASGGEDVDDRIERIREELDQFLMMFTLKYVPPEGSA